MNPLASFCDEGFMQCDLMHRTRPNQQGIRCVRRAQVTVTAAFDDQAQIVLARKVDGRNNVLGLRGRDGVNAWVGGPRIDPA